MFEVSIEDALKIYRQAEDTSEYPGKNDRRFKDGLIFPGVSPRFKISQGAQVFTIGSCFARNIEEKLTEFNLPTKQFAVPKSEWKARPNGLLNEYNPGTMLQRIIYALNGEGFGDRSIVKFGEGYVDLLLPGGTPVSMERAMARRAEIDDIYRALPQSDMVIITLGLVQSWYDVEEQLYLNRLPSPWSIKNSPGRYSLRILDVDTSYELLRSAVEKLIAAGIGKILVTVSPVPLQKAFNGMDASITNSFSKSVLRVCAHRLYSDFEQVDYFPSYEIALSGGTSVVADDNVHVTDEVVGKITQYMTEVYID